MAFWNIQRNEDREMNDSKKIDDFAESDDPEKIPATQPGTKFRVNRQQNESNLKRIRSDISECISLIDSEKLLCIHSLISSYNEDILVKEYADTLIETKMLPIALDPEDIDKWLTIRINTELDKELVISLIKNFLSYFQIKYFQNNTVNATKNKVHMFNPKVDFWIPQFTLLPKDALDSLNNLKRAFAIQYQGCAINGTDFSTQLLLLRNLKLINDYIKTECPDEPLQFLQYYMAVAFTKAKKEFIHEFKPKVIEWTEKPSRIRDTMPSWRKDSTKPPPNEPFNRFAGRIEKRILDDKESLSYYEIKKENDNFMKQSYNEVRKVKSRIVHGKCSSNPQTEQSRKVKLRIVCKKYPPTLEIKPSKESAFEHNKIKTSNKQQNRIKSPKRSASTHRKVITSSNNKTKLYSTNKVKTNQQNSNTMHFALNTFI